MYFFSKVIFFVFLFDFTYLQAGFVCNETSNSRYKDLQEAIQSAISGDILVVKGTIKTNATLMASPNLTRLTIKGSPGAILDGESKGRVLFVSGLIILTIEDLCIKNGFTEESGGGLYLTDNANLMLNRVTLIKNKSTKGSGGAIFANSGVTLFIQSSLFAKNEAYYYGGAIYFEAAQLAIEKTKIFYNSAYGDIFSSGGGLCLLGPSITQLRQSTICHNEAIFNGGGVLNIASAYTTIDETTLCLNQAHTGSGGAVANQQASLLFMHRSILKKNVAFAEGGGLFNKDLGSSAEIFKSKIIKNHSPLGAGIFNEAYLAKLLLIDTAIEKNDADDLVDF